MHELKPIRMNDSILSNKLVLSLFLHEKGKIENLENIDKTKRKLKQDLMSIKK